MPDDAMSSDLPHGPVHNEALPDVPDARRTRLLKIGGLILLAAALVVAAIGILARRGNDRTLAANAAGADVPVVSVVRPTTSGPGSGLALPGNVQAWNSAAIYARTSGYIRQWLADIGDHVRTGQALAVLDAPDLDQQLAQAKADYQTTVAQESLARTTSTRWATMLKQDAVSQQEADEKAGDYKAKQAVANASLANVKRLEALEGFTRLRAPFAGRVTSRLAQIGALVVAGTAGAQPLFTISDEHRVRVYVRVPQGSSSEIRPGLHATMTLPEYAGRTFDVVLARTAGAVDVGSGTVLVELQADNPDGALKPGAYAQVTFPISAVAGSVRIPSSALIFGDKGTNVALVDRDSRVTLKPVTIARDLGKQLEIAHGLSTADRVIDTPPDAIQTGDHVQIATARPADGG